MLWPAAGDAEIVLASRLHGKTKKAKCPILREVCAMSLPRSAQLCLPLIGMLVRGMRAKSREANESSRLLMKGRYFAIAPRSRTSSWHRAHRPLCARTAEAISACACCSCWGGRRWQAHFIIVIGRLKQYFSRRASCIEATIIMLPSPEIISERGSREIGEPAREMR